MCIDSYGSYHCTYGWRLLSLAFSVCCVITIYLSLTQVAVACIGRCVVLVVPTAVFLSMPVFLYFFHRHLQIMSTIQVI